MEIKITCLESRRAVVNENGAVFGLKKWAGKEVIIILPDNSEPSGISFEGDDPDENRKS